MKTKTTTIFMTLLFLFAFNVSSLKLESIQLDQSLQFYLTHDEGFGLNITELNAGGNNFIQINVQNNEGLESTTNLTIGDTMVFGINGSLPEWSGSTNGILNLSMLILGGESEFNYQKPWSVDPTTISLDGPPALMWPMIPIGQQFYWDTITADFQGMGYSVLDDGNEFTISFSNDTISSSIMYDKPTGLMKKYSYDGVIFSNDEIVSMTFSLEFLWILSPSHTTVLDWYSESTLLDYEVLEAKYNNGTEGFSLELNMQENEGSGPIYGYGELFKGDTVQGSFHSFRDFFIDGPPGYIFELDAPHGHIGFNISIDLPSSSPEFNNRYFIPMLPKTDLELIKGYFGVSDVMAEGYSHEFTNTEITLTYVDEFISISATWDVPSGILTHWKGIETANDGSNIEFQIVAYDSIDNFDLHWGANIGDEITLEVNQLEVEGSNQLELEDSGYIAEGDLVTFEVIGLIEGGDEGPPAAFYYIEGPNGYQNNASIFYSYPGTLEFDGPPMLFPYILLGNDNFHNWLQKLYTHAGAIYSVTNDEISLNWMFGLDDGSSTLLQVTWRSSDGALLTYVATNSLADDSIRYHLDFSNVDFDSPTDPESNGSPGLSVNTATIFVAIIAIPILKKKRLKTFI